MHCVKCILKFIVSYKIKVNIPYFLSTLMFIDSIIHPINIIMMWHDGILVTVIRYNKCHDTFVLDAASAESGWSLIH